MRRFRHVPCDGVVVLVLDYVCAGAQVPAGDRYVAGGVRGESH